MKTVLRWARAKFSLFLSHQGRCMSHQVSIYYEEQSNQSDEVKLVLGARLNSSRASGVFYRISKQHGDGVTWIPAYRSEVLRPSDDDPPLVWKPLETRLRVLCNANVTRPLLIEVRCLRKRDRSECGFLAVLLQKSGHTSVGRQDHTLTQRDRKCRER